jgi:hypothetical protein
MPEKDLKSNTATNAIPEEKTQREITVTFDEKKLAALEFYLKDHKLTAQNELQNYLSTKFLRAVPSEVRRFNFPEAEQELQGQTAAFADPARKANGRTSEQKEALNAARREQRRREQRRMEKLAEQGQNPTQPGQSPPAEGGIKTPEPSKAQGMVQAQ